MILSLVRTFENFNNRHSDLLDCSPFQFLLVFLLLSARPLFWSPTFSSWVWEHIEIFGFVYKAGSLFPVYLSFTSDFVVYGLCFLQVFHIYIYIFFCELQITDSDSISIVYMLTFSSIRGIRSGRWKNNL